MKNTDLYIVAAGKGSRMGGSIPKALVPVLNGEPNISNTLRKIGHKFRNVFIIANVDVQDKWFEYLEVNEHQPFISNVFVVPVTSGFGDGHATLQGINDATAIMLLNDSAFKNTENIVVCWGDAFIQYEQTVDELLQMTKNRPDASGVIPAVLEKDPYVTLLVNKQMDILGADMSKIGEKHPSGYHDQSIFCFDSSALASALWYCHACFWKNGRYITPGGELSILFALHFLYNVGRPASMYQTDYPTKAFNTPEELEQIRKEANV